MNKLNVAAFLVILPGRHFLFICNTDNKDVPYIS